MTTNKNYASPKHIVQTGTLNFADIEDWNVAETEGCKVADTFFRRSGKLPTKPIYSTPGLKLKLKLKLKPQIKLKPHIKLKQCFSSCLNLSSSLI